MGEFHPLPAPMEEKSLDNLAWAGVHPDTCTGAGAASYCLCLQHGSPQTHTGSSIPPSCSPLTLHPQVPHQTWAKTCPCSGCPQGHRGGRGPKATACFEGTRAIQPLSPAPLPVSPAGPAAAPSSLFGTRGPPGTKKSSAGRRVPAVPLTPLGPGSLMQAHRELALLATSTASFVSQTPVPGLCLSSAKVSGAGVPGGKYLECAGNS